MTSRTELPTAVVTELPLTPQQWEAVCVLAARAGWSPQEWMMDAIDDCIDAGVDALPPVADLRGCVSAAVGRSLVSGS